MKGAIERVVWFGRVAGQLAELGSSEGLNFSKHAIQMHPRRRLLDISITDGMARAIGRL
jgi:hypothetical protein